MERLEVTALVSPTARRRRLQEQQQSLLYGRDRGGSGADAGPAGFAFGDDARQQEIALEAVDEEAFLKTLEERLQEHIPRLDAVVLVLAAHQVNYLAYRLHDALEPKRDPETDVIQAWTIQPQSPMKPLKAKMGSHLQVLKLSTTLREVRALRVYYQSQELPRSNVIEMEIFPSLRALEIVHTPVALLHNVHFFARQLRRLRLEHVLLHSLRDILSPSSDTSREATRWTHLETLHVNCCELPVVDACVNALQGVRELDLGWNSITRIEAPLTQAYTLQTLCLCHNKLTVFPPILALSALTRLDLSMNEIPSLRGVEALTSLKWLDVSYNQLRDIAEMALVAKLSHLQALHVRDNPIVRRPDHRREVLFYLGEKVMLDQSPWTTTELQSMRNRRQLNGVQEDLGSGWLSAAISPLSRIHSFKPDQHDKTVVIGYPALAPVKSITPNVAAIRAAPRRFSPQRWIAQQALAGKLVTSASGTVASPMHAKSSVEGTRTEVTEDTENVPEGRSGDRPLVRTVDDFFRAEEVEQTSVTRSGRKNSNAAISIYEGGGERDSDNDSNASESGRERNRSRKYTESDFMRDFEEEEMLVREGDTDVVRAGTSGSARSYQTNDNQATTARDLNVRVLLSADDASVYDLSFGIDGISASVNVKSQEILETLHVEDRETAISFSRRLPDIVALGTSTHSHRGKIIVLKMRKQDNRTCGSVTYQLDSMNAFTRVLGPLIAHLYAGASQHHPRVICVCVNCRGISHVTSEYAHLISSPSPDSSAPSDLITLSTCLLCSSYNVREITQERMVAIHLAEGISLAGRVGATSMRPPQVEDGFSVEEQELDPNAPGEVYDCVLISSHGIREALVTSDTPEAEEESRDGDVWREITALA